MSGGTHSITLDGVEITCEICPFEINSGAEVSLTLVGANTINSRSGGPGLAAQSGSNLTINGSGSLTATSSGYGAGTGGDNSQGKIIINGGTVTAIGNLMGAGIDGGGGQDGGGMVTITGGNVVATGGCGVAGRTVTITGGNVKATGSSGGADIGAGAGNSNNGDLTNGQDSVYRITLTLDGAEANTPIASLNATGDSYNYTYGMKDVKTIDANKLYIYLPAGTTVESILTAETPARRFTNLSGTDITVAGNQNNTGTLTPVAAAIADVTVSGAPDRALASASATITLTGEKFKALSAEANVSAWFTNLPTGLTAKLSTAVAENATTAEVTFSGTPTAVITAAITAEIPAAALVGGVALPVTDNADAKWHISNPTVTSVMVNPATVSIQKGGSQTFNATVTGENSPAQTVTWTVTGSVAGTSIDADGNLMIAANETAGTLTVRAISTVDPTQSGTATATVTTPAPTVTSVSVSPATVSITKGGSQTFTATVIGENGSARTVTWTVNGRTSDLTAISESGVLSVGSDETAGTLTVTATSTADPTKSGTATVTVTTPPTPPAPDPIQYAIIKGRNSEWTKNSENGLGITVDANYSKLTGVSVDGVKISNDMYTAQSGSTIVTLKAAYLESLLTGWHTLRVNFTDGYAETNFTIKAATNPDIPATGDSAQTVLWQCIALLAGIGLAAILFLQRKRIR